MDRGLVDGVGAIAIVGEPGLGGVALRAEGNDLSQCAAVDLGLEQRMLCVETENQPHLQRNASRGAAAATRSPSAAVMASGFSVKVAIPR